MILNGYINLFILLIFRHLDRLEYKFIDNWIEFILSFNFKSTLS